MESETINGRRNGEEMPLGGGSLIGVRDDIGQFCGSLKQISGSYFDDGKLPKFLSVLDLVDKFKRLGLAITGERVVELCDSGRMPCFFFAGNKLNPVFVWDDVQKWAASNLLEYQPGEAMQIRVVVPPGSKTSENVPEALSAMEALYEFKDPAVPCIYFLVDRGEVTYVGQTTNLPSRILAHTAQKSFQRAFFIPVPTSQLSSTETKFIRLLRPRDNISQK